MAAHQAGFANVVASLGTALTRGQVELATRYADAVALAYDVDLAGEAATQRGLLEELGPVSREQGAGRAHPRRQGPGRADPHRSRRLAQAVAEAAEPLLDYFMERAAAEVDLASVRAGSELHRPRARPAAAGARPGRADSYLQQLARLVDVDERVLREALARGARPIPFARAGRTSRGTDARTPARAPGARGADAPAPAPVAGGGAASRRAAPVPRCRGAGARPRMARARVDGGGHGATSRHSLASLDPRHRRPRPRPAGVGPDARSAPGSSRTARQLRICLRAAPRPAHRGGDLDDGRRSCRGRRDDERPQTARELERQIHQLGREKAELTRAMKEPALAAGERRS